jgi:hypothetical protein
MRRSNERIQTRRLVVVERRGGVLEGEGRRSCVWRG